MLTSRTPNSSHGYILTGSLCVTIFFGLYGSFISDNLVLFQRVHYYPLAFAAFVAVVFACRKSLLLSLLVIVFVLLVFSGLLSGQQAFSFYSLFIGPPIWFQVGRYCELSVIRKFLLLQVPILLTGSVLEVNNLLFEFPQNNYSDLEGAAARRFGSFALNPLALGYILIPISSFLITEKKTILRIILLFATAYLLILSNSRGAVALIIAFLIVHELPSIYRIFQGKPAKSRLIFIMLIFLAGCLGIFLFLPSISGRFLSAFDWTADEGNLGRINQWTYCLSNSFAEPLSFRPGAMTPIGLEGDPYIEIGVVKSCDSTPLQIFFEYGILGILVFVATAYFILSLCFKVLFNQHLCSSRDPQIMPQIQASQNTAIFSLIHIISSLVLVFFLQQFSNQTLSSVWIGALYPAFAGYIYQYHLNSQAI